MDTVTCDQILHELFTVIKLVTYTLVSTIVLLVKNYVLPARLIEKKIEDQIVLITGAGIFYAFFYSVMFNNFRF
jgi:hypothetical protein